MILLHMGALHPVEKALTLALAFGPFLLLGLVVWLRRRVERREDARVERTGAERAGAGSSPTESGQVDR